MSQEQPRREDFEQSTTAQNDCVQLPSAAVMRQNHPTVHISPRLQVAEEKVQQLPLTPEAVYREGRTEITIGEALEATALTSGSKAVDYSDAAAIQAAEVRATGRTNIVPGGVAAAAQSAATRNSRITRYEDKTKLSEILSDATTKLPSDKPVTRRDAEGVIGAELRNDPNIATHPGGVAASMVAAARINQSKHSSESS